MQIIVCDDNNIQLDIMSNYINNYLIRNKLTDKSEVVCFESADKIYDTIDDMQIDVAFLDIEMDGMDGIALSKIIRKKFEDVIIVFVTGFRDHAITAFSVRALDYLIKPISSEKIESLLDEVFTLFQENKTKDFVRKNIKYFSFKRNRELTKVPYHEIVAFEKTDRKIRVFCLEGVYEFAGTFKTLKQEIDMDEFLQCHQSYIINKEYIKEFSNPEIIVSGIGLKVPVNRSSKSMVKNLIRSIDN